MKTYRLRARLRRAFTLIELLLVMVIIVVLAAIVVPKFAGRGEDAKKAAATAQIGNFSTSLNLYEVDNGSYPTTAQGLDALVNKPTTTPEPKNWKKTIDSVPLDPWGNAYVYRSPGTNNADGYDLSTPGPDGQEGTEDDITNWGTSQR